MYYVRLYWRVEYHFFESFWFHLDILKSISASCMPGMPWTTTLWGTPYRPTMPWCEMACWTALTYTRPGKCLDHYGTAPFFTWKTHVMSTGPCSSSQTVSHYQSRIFVERISLGLGILKNLPHKWLGKIMSKQRRGNHQWKIQLSSTKWGPLAKLVYKSNNFGLWSLWLLLISIHGVYTLVYNWGAPHCRYFQVHLLRHRFDCARCSTPRTTASADAFGSHPLVGHSRDGEIMCVYIYIYIHHWCIYSCIYD